MRFEWFVAKRYLRSPYRPAVLRLVTAFSILGVAAGVATLVIALNYERFGGVLGLIVNWFAALLGPTSMPLILGLLPAFKSCGPKAAIASIGAGLITFVITKDMHLSSLALEVGLPTIVSAIVFIGVGLITKTVPVKVNDLNTALKKNTSKQMAYENEGI